MITAMFGRILNFLMIICLFVLWANANLHWEPYLGLLSSSAEKNPSHGNENANSGLELASAQEEQPEGERERRASAVTAPRLASHSSDVARDEPAPDGTEPKQSVAVQGSESADPSTAADVDARPHTPAAEQAADDVRERSAAETGIAERRDEATGPRIADEAGRAAAERERHARQSAGEDARRRGAEARMEAQRLAAAAIRAADEASRATAAREAAEHELKARKAAAREAETRLTAAAMEAKRQAAAATRSADEAGRAAAARALAERTRQDQLAAAGDARDRAATARADARREVAALMALADRVGRAASARRAAEQELQAQEEAIRAADRRLADLRDDLEEARGAVRALEEEKQSLAQETATARKEADAQLAAARAARGQARRSRAARESAQQALDESRAAKREADARARRYAQEAAAANNEAEVQRAAARDARRRAERYDKARQAAEEAARHLRVAKADADLRLADRSALEDTGGTAAEPAPDDGVTTRRGTLPVPRPRPSRDTLALASSSEEPSGAPPAFSAEEIGLVRPAAASSRFSFDLSQGIEAELEIASPALLEEERARWEGRGDDVMYRLRFEDGFVVTGVDGEANPGFYVLGLTKGSRSAVLRLRFAASEETGAPPSVRTVVDRIACSASFGTKSLPCRERSS